MNEHILIRIQISTFIQKRKRQRRLKEMKTSKVVFKIEKHHDYDPNRHVETVLLLETLRIFFPDKWY